MTGPARTEFGELIFRLASYAAAGHTTTTADIVRNACSDEGLEFVHMLFRTYWEAATSLHSDLGMMHLRDWFMHWSLRPEFDDDFRMAARVIGALDLAADTGDGSLRETAVATFEELAGAVDDAGRTYAVIGGIAHVFAIALPILHHPAGLELLVRCADEVAGE